jgi:ribonucleoside-diphosphate reductase alpha chain
MDYIFRWLQLRFLSGHQLSLFSNLGGSSAVRAEVEQPLESEGAALESAASEQDAQRFERRAPGGGIVPEAPSAGSGGSEAGQSSLKLEDRGIYGGSVHGGSGARGSAVFHAAEAMKEYLDMGDAPSCHTCGAIMVRNGSCYRCMSCGSTSGCS